MKNQPKKKAFVLMMVLVILGLCGVVLAAVARSSCRLALDASTAREDLQRKWGFISCRSAFLAQAEKMLEGVPDISRLAGPAAVPAALLTRSKQIELGKMTFEIKLSDEQAKLNLNMLAGRQKDGTEASAALLAGRQRQGIQVRLLPSPPPPGSLSKFPLVFRSYDQVFEYARPQELLGDPQEPMDDQELAIDYLTCWGSGLVNYKRSPIEVVRIAAAGILTEEHLDKIEKLLRAKSRASIKQIAEHLELSEKQAQKLRDVFIEKSTCHSLWIVARGKKRSWHQFIVESAADATGDAQRLTFTW